MYLEDQIDTLFERYPKFFTGQRGTLLKSIANNESNNNYRNLSYKILSHDGKIMHFINLIFSKNMVP